MTLGHGQPRHALGDHRLGLRDDEGDDQDEGEDEQRRARRAPGSSRSTYRSSVRIAAEAIVPHHERPPRPARPAVAHAPAVLSRPRRRASRSCRGCGCTRSRTTAAWSPRCGRCPGMRATFNLVPSLVEQVEAYADERTWDRHLVLGLAEAETLPAADAAWFVREAFHAHAADDDRPVPALRRTGGAGAARGAVHGRRPARPAGLAEAGLDRSRGADGRPAGAAAGGEGPRLRRGRQAGAARPRARAAAPGGAGLPRGRRRRRGRALDLAVLPPDPAAAVRLGGAPSPRIRAPAAAAAVPASRGRGAAAAAGGRRRTSAGSAGRPPASGPPRAACRTRRRRRSRAPASAGWPATRGSWRDRRRRRRSTPAPIASRTRWRRRPGKSASCSATTRCPTWSGSPIRAGAPRPRWPTSSPGSARPAPVAAAHGGGRPGGAGHPRRRERLGALSGGGRPFLRALYRGLVGGRRHRPGHDARRGGGPGPTAVGDLRRLVDQQRLRHLDRPPRRPPGLGAARRGPRPVRGRGPMPPPSGGPPRSTRCWPPRAATGAGGTATTTRRPTIATSTRCSGATSAASMPRSTSRCPRRSTGRIITTAADAGAMLRPGVVAADGPRGSYFTEVGAVSLERSGGAMHRASAGPVTDARVGLVPEGVVVTVELARRHAPRRHAGAGVTPRRGGSRLRPGRSPTAPARCRGRRSAVRLATRSACGSWPATTAGRILQTVPGDGIDRLLVVPSGDLGGDATGGSDASVAGRPPQTINSRVSGRIPARSDNISYVN